jgi:hypothetical protein
VSDPLDDRDEDIAEVANARLLEELSETEKRAQLTRILQNEDVRDYLWRFLKSCNIYQTVAHTNFGSMNLLEGRRCAGLQLLNEICEADPNAEMLMRKKAIDLAAQQVREAAAKKARRQARSQ